MDGVYCEHLVKRKMTVGAFFGLIGMSLGIFAALLCIVTAQMMAAGILVVAVGIIVFIFWKYLRVEYEYIFVTDELQIDKIYSGSLRKKGPRIEIRDMESVERADLPVIREAKKDGNATVEDFTSGEKDKEVYAIRYARNDRVHYLLFEPNEKLLKTMQRVSPRKVRIEN